MVRQISYDKETVKEQIELDDVYNLLDFLDAEPQMYSNYIVARTICHNGDTHKLYYYENTNLFKCYTSSCGSFDIFELIQKVQEVDLNTSIYFIVNYFNLQHKIDEVDEDSYTEDWKIFKQYEKIAGIEIKNERLELPQIPNYIEHYPEPNILNWEQEGISKDICHYMGIKYNPVNGSVIIPHKDQNGRLVGIRQRTLVQEDEIYGKYRPARFQNQLCNHPLAFNLYGLNEAKNNIRDLRTVIVVESEKSVLQYLSYFGTKSDICVAVCGSSLSKYQFQLLLDYNIQELVIGFDKDFDEIGSEDYNKVVNKLQKIYDKYSSYVNVSFLFDRENNILGYKNSPLDCGKDAFLHLWQNRITI